MVVLQAQIVMLRSANLDLTTPATLTVSLHITPCSKEMLLFPPRRIVLEATMEAEE